MATPVRDAPQRRAWRHGRVGREAVVAARNQRLQRNDAMEDATPRAIHEDNDVTAFEQGGKGWSSMHDLAWLQGGPHALAADQEQFLAPCESSHAS